MKKEFSKTHLINTIRMVGASNFWTVAFDVVCVFMYLFSFFWVGGRGINSTMIVVAYMAIYALIKRDFMSSLLKMLRNRFVWALTGLYVITNLWVIVCLLVNKSSDFSFLITFLHVFFQIAAGVLLYKFLEYRKTKERITDYLMISFTAQTAIQWLACFIPFIREVIYFTKDAETISKSISYGGVRAVALSGSNFFGLSAAYALVALLFWSEKNTLLQKNRALKLLLYCFMMSGTFFAGRTGFVGVIFAILFLGIRYFLDRKTGKRLCLSEGEKKAAKILGIAAAAAVLIGVVLYFTVERFRTLIIFAFQPLFSLFQSGTLMVSSVANLLSMYIPIPVDALLFGHGKYDGYYMGTDVGYLRVVLYMGIIGFILLFCMQWIIIQPNKGEERLMKWVLLLCLLTLNLKGEVITWAMIVLGVGLLYCLQDHHCVDDLVVGGQE